MFPQLIFHSLDWWVDSASVCPISRCLAKGGIVTRPTLALIGESGPEAVIPLRGSETAGNVNNFEFHIQSPIPDEKGIVSLVNRSQRLQAMLP